MTTFHHVLSSQEEIVVHVFRILAPCRWLMGQVCPIVMDVVRRHRNDRRNRT